ncbi:Hypothetical predicted protein [Marmota monax]|uniref:Uncharacterized protein n=1 Tax=Marmota monax TaxID=9995 RepID=A0A5E4A4K5_MARMO|nr:Hypothetical predicted protein [Marmota monax]
MLCTRAQEAAGAGRGGAAAVTSARPVPEGGACHVEAHRPRPPPGGGAPPWLPRPLRVLSLSHAHSLQVRRPRRRRRRRPAPRNSGGTMSSPPEGKLETKAGHPPAGTDSFPLTLGGAGRGRPPRDRAPRCPSAGRRGVRAPGLAVRRPVRDSTAATRCGWQTRARARRDPLS